MKILIIPDSFKNSISSEEYCKIVKNALISKYPNVQIFCFPMADGGENTASIITRYKKIPVKSYTVTAADGNRITANIPVSDTNEAFLESALVVGLDLPTTQSVSPLNRSTAGIGELIQKLYDDGCRSVYVGLGGSGTNDGGYGLLESLGVKFEYRTNADELLQLSYIDRIFSIESADFTGFFKNFSGLRLFALTDVENPLLGNAGATAVFGKQKGVTQQQFNQFETALKHLNEICSRALKKEYASIPGSGAAGGLGFALCVLNAEIISGADYLIELYEIKKQLHNADLVITGEGRSDSQTLFGKLPQKISTLCKSENVPCILISGGIIPDDYEQLNHSFTACFDICSQPMTLDEAVAVTAENLKNVAQSVFSTFIALK